MWKGTEGVALVYWWCTIPVDLEMDRISPSLHIWDNYSPERLRNLTDITQQITHKARITTQVSEAPKLLTRQWGMIHGWGFRCLPPTGYLPTPAWPWALHAQWYRLTLGHLQGQKEYAGRIEKIFQLKVTSFLHVSGKQEKENSLKIILFWIYISQNLFIQQIFIDFLLWAKFCSRSQEHKVPVHRKLTFKWKRQKPTSQRKTKRISDL